MMTLGRARPTRTTRCSRRRHRCRRELRPWAQAALAATTRTRASANYFLSSHQTLRMCMSGFLARGATLAASTTR
eukprot:6203527-Pleurochrysis_carterae.AAC.3